MEPGQIATVVVTFIEDRDGRALVRLPNGSKASLEYAALDPSLANGRFVRTEQHVAVWCGEGDDWTTEAETWPEARDALEAHYRDLHRPS